MVIARSYKIRKTFANSVLLIIKLLSFNIFKQSMKIWVKKLILMSLAAIITYRCPKQCNVSFLSHIFSCKIYCSCHHLHFFPLAYLLHCFSLILLNYNTEENHILESPLLRGIYLSSFLGWGGGPDENMVTACNKNQSYSAFDGFF